ncbi:DUF2158 domain-containing protein [Wohlfahrtiimonas populi]|uniref:DUF2158 domain-containing protein n=1 Tax=Wohlfahrtiimonas populi TaxID=1940240 RepID=UPI00098D6BB5|nr:DUF2158 domain-containing protein [Wohlfahrtiimonas populi]
MTFSIGMIVTLASGGPEMAVIEVERESILCKWFSEEGSKFIVDSFPPQALVMQTLNNVIFVAEQLVNFFC